VRSVCVRIVLGVLVVVVVVLLLYFLCWEVCRACKGMRLLVQGFGELVGTALTAELAEGEGKTGCAERR
jgi:hypothetical protein